MSSQGLSTSQKIKKIVEEKANMEYPALVEWNKLEYPLHKLDK